MRQRRVKLGAALGGHNRDLSTKTISVQRALVLTGPNRAEGQNPASRAKKALTTEGS